MSKFTLNEVKFNPGTVHEKVGRRFEFILDRDEASTIYFALLEYKKSLDESYRKWGTTDAHHHIENWPERNPNSDHPVPTEMDVYEEAMFLTDALSKVSELLFEMTANQDQHVRDLLDVI